jgi:hypothetical protein
MSSTPDFNDVLRSSAIDLTEDYIKERSYQLASVSMPETSWRYEESLIDRLQLTIVTNDLGWHGDISIDWIKLSDGVVAPRVKAFDDSWQALAYLAPLLDKLGEGRGICPEKKGPNTPADVIDLLKSEGWTPTDMHGTFVASEWEENTGEKATNPSFKTRNEICSVCSGAGFQSMNAPSDEPTIINDIDSWMNF